MASGAGLRGNAAEQVADGPDGAVAAADHTRDQAGPFGLMRGAAPGVVVAMEILVEQQVVFPRRVVLQALDPAWRCGPRPPSSRSRPVEPPRTAAGTASRSTMDGDNEDADSGLRSG